MKSATANLTPCLLRARLALAGFLSWNVLVSVPLLLAGPILVPLSNASFESPTVSTGNNWSSPVQNWVNSSPAPGIRRTASGFPPASHGSQYAWFTNTWPTANLELTQYYNSIDGNSRYELLADIWPLQNPTNCSAQVRLGDLTVGRFMVEKLYRPFWNTNLAQFQLTNGAWTTVKVDFHPDDFPGIHGHTLVVNLAGREVLMDNVRLFRTPITNAPTATYHISSSVGNDGADGLSPATAWRSFTNANDRRFSPGSTLLLKRGDVWHEELSLRGNGQTGLTNWLGAYGVGPRPLIVRADKLFDVGITLNNASHWRVGDLEVRDGSVGLFLRFFESAGHTNLVIESCRFTGMDSWVLDPSLHNLERAWSGGIRMSGILKDSQTNTTVLSGLAIRNCMVEDATSCFGVAWYYPPPYRARLVNVLVEDTHAVRCLSDGIALTCTSNAVVRRFRSFGAHQQTGAFPYGTTSGFVNSSTDVLFEDCEFSDTRRFWPDRTQGDGSGFDVDGFTDRVTLRRCVFHNNDAQGLFTLGTYGLPNNSVLLSGSTFWNNALNASDDTYAPGGNAYELKFTEFTMVGGVATNLGLYRNHLASNWVYKPASALVTLGNLRQQWWTNYATRPTAPAWELDAPADFQGWTNLNQWNSPVVSGGTLRGVAAGNDPFAYSPPLWVNTHRNSRHVRLRLKTSAGNLGVLYFTTEADGNWDLSKAVGFPLVADNEFHEYVIDLRSSPGYGGVVTQLRLDPTDAAGAQFELDYLRWQPGLNPDALKLVQLEDTRALLRCSSDPGQTFLLQASSNLIHWSNLATNVTDPLGETWFADPDAGANVAQRFYRLLWP